MYSLHELVNVTIFFMVLDKHFFRLKLAILFCLIFQNKTLDDNKNWLCKAMRTAAHNLNVDVTILYGLNVSEE